MLTKLTAKWMISLEGDGPVGPGSLVEDAEGWKGCTYKLPNTKQMCLQRTSCTALAIPHSCARPLLEGLVILFFI